MSFDRKHAGNFSISKHFIVQFHVKIGLTRVTTKLKQEVTYHYHL